MEYLKLAKYYENHFSKNKIKHLAVNWPNKRDCLKRFEVMLKIIEDYPCKVLDFGCGNAMLLDYIIDKKLQVNYVGLDINKKAIDYCKKKYKEYEFMHMDIEKINLKNKKIDFIIANGVFTVKDSLSQKQMWNFFSKTLIKLFKISKKGVAFNLFSTNVDWKRKDLFHVPLDKLTNFFCKELTRNFVIRNDYGLYEYTVYIRK